MTQPEAVAPLGLFGGTFDPVHFGHLRLAEEACEQLALARVRWLPAGAPAHREAPFASAAERLAMIRLAVEGNELFEVDDAEVQAQTPSYTVPSLERLRSELGNRQPLVLLLGTDAFSALPTWHRWQELLRLTHIAVIHRAGKAPQAGELPADLVRACVDRHIDDPAQLATQPAGLIASVPMTPLTISATDIRRRLATGRSAQYLVPPQVLNYLHQRRLYA